MKPSEMGQTRCEPGSGAGLTHAADGFTDVEDRHPVDLLNAARAETAPQRPGPDVAREGELLRGSGIWCGVDLHDDVRTAGNPDDHVAPAVAALAVGDDRQAQLTVGTYVGGDRREHLVAGQGQYDPGQTASDLRSRGGKDTMSPVLGH